MVEFRLTRPDATFLTLVLPDVMIDSRAVIEAAYAPLAARAPECDAAEYQAASDAIFTQLGSDPADCESLLPRAEPLLDAAAIGLLPRDQFRRPDGTFDVCMNAEWNAIFLSNLARSLGTTGLDAERDVDEARRLIESSGWTEGNDGIYQRDGERLAAENGVGGATES